ncbi:MAG: GlsB/YeaQ/YmgE family stress response membrane protein [Armatimonadetes bacterium]|nr:GlsB/YeaQ/YmgE family stress response membrane protein [Armatimonadota bacterium]
MQRTAIGSGAGTERVAPLESERPRRGRQVLFIALGAAAVALIAAFAGRMPAQGLRAWEVFSLAAGKPEPTFVDQFEMLLEAIRQNAAAWRVVSLIIVGSIAGMAAELVVPVRRVGGKTGAVLLGIFGAAVGGLVCERCGYSVPAGITLASVGVAFAASVITLLSARLVARY